MSESSTGEILFYKSDEGDIKINVIFENDTIWLSQKQMGELFDTSKQNISLHLQNCFETGEISEEATVKNFLTVQKEGNREVKREVVFYNLDAIIAVGYRVNSYKATKFRIWATNVLKEYVIKGFVMDDERLKNGPHFGKDYFEELLARIREIRASERRFYQKITDIYATSVDYDSRAQITKDFFAEVQNKFLFAVSGSTATENERQYSANYHVLETIAKYDNPEIRGKTGMRDYSEQKSLYCKKTEVKNSFRELIQNIDAKYVFLSYNCEGLMSFDDIKEVMSERGEYGVFTKEYRRFKSG